VIIDNFLTAPIVFGDKTIGLLSVANKPVSGYDEIKAGAYVNLPHVLERLGLAVRKELDRPT
jgi:hypothetical protein